MPGPAFAAAPASRALASDAAEQDAKPELQQARQVTHESAHAHGSGAPARHGSQRPSPDCSGSHDRGRTDTELAAVEPSPWEQSASVERHSGLAPKTAARLGSDQRVRARSREADEAAELLSEVQREHTAAARASKRERSRSPQQQGKRARDGAGKRSAHAARTIEWDSSVLDTTPAASAPNSTALPTVEKAGKPAATSAQPKVSDKPTAAAAATVAATATAVNKPPPVRKPQASGTTTPRNVSASGGADALTTPSRRNADIIRQVNDAFEREMQDVRHGGGATSGWSPQPVIERCERIAEKVVRESGGFMDDKESPIRRLRRAAELAVKSQENGHEELTAEALRERLVRSLQGPSSKVATRSVGGAGGGIGAGGGSRMGDTLHVHFEAALGHEMRKGSRTGGSSGGGHAHGAADKPRADPARTVSPGGARSAGGARGGINNAALVQAARNAVSGEPPMPAAGGAHKQSSGPVKSTTHKCGLHTALTLPVGFDQCARVPC